MNWIAISGAMVGMLAFSPCALAANPVNLTPTSNGDGEFTTTSIGGQTVWQNINGDGYLYFRVSGFTFTNGIPVYVRVVYYDGGFGSIGVQYDSVSGGAYSQSLTHARTSRVNSQAFATAYFELFSPALLGRQNAGASFRLYLNSGGGIPMSIQSVTIQNFPFNDSNFLLALSKPWLHPYSGPSREDVDNTTLNGKTMAGYQGWFSTPNDLTDGGWVHWVRNNQVNAANYNIDMWPDLSGYANKELFSTDTITNRSGQPAKLFSSSTPETVRRHFQWMRKYNIDGAFLQRFLGPNSGGPYGGSEWVLNNVREAAHREGRLWAIEYDVSSLNDGNALATLTNDWRWMVDVFGVRNDSRYAHEGTNLVVFIWGLPFPSRGFTQTTANAIVDFFQNDPVYGGNYVIGGWPNNWRTDSTLTPAWNDHFQRYDAALAWQTQNAANYLADYQQLKTWGMDYFAHVWPGFSWAHLQSLTNESAYTPRTGGTFYWQKINQAVSSGATRLFFGMFDEYDEGTAIMPMTDDPPPPRSSSGRFLTNLGKPSDWWLLMSGAARDVLLGYRTNSATMPTEAELTNQRANIGPEAYVNLGATNQPVLLYPVDNADGHTSAEMFAGRDCRFNTAPATDQYFYFNVDDAFAYAAATGLSATIEVDYYDITNNVSLNLQYDSLQGAYTSYPAPVPMRGSGQWRTARFNVSNAYFVNRQNAGADFRFNISGTAIVHIDQVRVVLPDNLPPARQATTLVSPESVWKYVDSGVFPGATWTDTGFNDSAWPAGSAPLGRNVGGEATLITRRNTTWYRRAFVISNPADYLALVVGVVRDDGAVAYLNGQEIYRGNMPAGTITSTTFATNNEGGFNATAFFEKNVDSSLLVPGTNMLAVELHLVNGSTSDLRFDLTLTGLLQNQVRPNLTFVSPNVTTMKWPANMGNYTLYSTADLKSWIATTNMPVLSNGVWNVTLPPPTNSQMFFRLRAQ